MSELSFCWLKARGVFFFFLLRYQLSKSSERNLCKKTFRRLITSGPADHLGRQKQALELQSIIDLSECIHIGDSRLSLCSIPQILTQVMAILELTGKESKDPHHLLDRSSIWEINSIIVM